MKLKKIATIFFVSIISTDPLNLTNPAYAQAGFQFIDEVAIESPEIIEQELDKNKHLFEELDQVENATGEKFFVVGSGPFSPKLPRISKFESSHGNLSCAPETEGAEQGNTTCREALLAKMCVIELNASGETISLEHCKQLVSIYDQNQASHNERGKVESGENLCSTMPLQRSRYKYIDREILEVALQACKQLVLIDDVSTLMDNSLWKVNELYQILGEPLAAEAFYINLLENARDKLNEVEDGEWGMASYETKMITSNAIYPLLVFLGDIYFKSEDYDQAVNFYLEADKIAKRMMKQETMFLSDVHPRGGWVSEQSFLRLESFVVSQARLATILIQQGNSDAAENYLVAAIAALEKESKAQAYNKDAITMQEVGSLLYSTYQNILIDRKDYARALELADRSRSLVYTGSFTFDKTAVMEKTQILTFQDMQTLAQEQNATFVVYTIPDLIFYDYEKFTNQQDQVLIWVVQPNGELDFQKIDVASTLAISHFESDLAFSKTLTFPTNTIGFSILAIGITLLGSFYLQRKRTTLVSLAWISFIVLFIQACSSQINFNFSKIEYSDQDNILSSLTTNTLSVMNSRGQDDNSLSQEACYKEQDCLQGLYKILIQPIDDLFSDDPEQHIVFVPHRGLHRVPFAALQDKKGQYFVENHTTRIVPSLQTLKDVLERAATRISPNDEYLIVGNPIMPKISFGRYGEPELIPQLPAAEIEAKEIAKMYGTNALIGEEASLEAVESKILDSKIIHLATHGYLNVRVLGQSALALTPVPSEDDYSPQAKGILSTETIYNNRLVAEMAVLSACNTGLGVETVEGNLGLTRPFLVSGVPTVVSSLWSVPDQSTGKLMIDFHKNLQVTSDKAQALRQAMLTTMEEYSEPLYWGGFTLTGLAKLPQSSPSAKAIIGQKICGNAYFGSGIDQNTEDLYSATLESSSSGFNLILDETTKFELNDQLVVEEVAGWNLVAYNKEPFEIDSDGYFNIRMMVSTRSYCTFKGKLEFIGDAASKLEQKR